MTVIARFEVIPIREQRMSDAIARALDALDRFPVSYELTATDTVIEGESVDQVFAAVQAAHEAIPHERVITSVEIDEIRGRRQDMYDRIESVERTLGRPARRIHRSPGTSESAQPPRQSSHTPRQPPRESRQPSQEPRQPPREPPRNVQADRRSTEGMRSPERSQEHSRHPMPTPHDNRM